MLVLDTDHMSLLEWGGHGSAALRERLADIAPDEVATTVISYEEQIRGWMAYIARAKRPHDSSPAFQRGEWRRTDHAIGVASRPALRSRSDRAMVARRFNAGNEIHPHTSGVA